MYEVGLQHRVETCIASCLPASIYGGQPPPQLHNLTVYPKLFSLSFSSLSLLSLTTHTLSLVYLSLTLQLKIPLPRANLFNASPPMISTTGPERPLSASHSPPYSPAPTQSIPLSSSSSSSSPSSSSKNHNPPPNSNVPAVILPPRSGLSSPSSSALTPHPAGETPNPDQSPIPLDNPPLSPASFASSSSSLVDEDSIPVGPRDLDR